MQLLHHTETLKTQNDFRSSFKVSVNLIWRDFNVGLLYVEGMFGNYVY